MATESNYSPYFLRHYERLRHNFLSFGNNNAIIIGHTFGYIFGEVNPTIKRNSISADIYFIYIKPMFRKNGNGSFVVTLFEREVILRYNSIIGKTIGQIIKCHFTSSIEIRIANKYCIRTNTPFWNKNGFIGDINSDQLTKYIYF